METGIFTISLDFELHWGVSETRTVESYRENLLGTRPAIQGILEMFNKYEIHATWATVGMLFCKNKKELMHYADKVDKPSYTEKKLCNFLLAKNIGNDFSDDPYHYAPDVIELIATYPNQEISTHTFSHYYCLEEGQNINNFESDLKAAISIAAEIGINFQSIIFPRNQYSEPYLQVCKQYGINAFRGNQQSGLYAPMAKEAYKSKWRRIGRLLDAYVNISGQHAFKITKPENGEMLNIPGSRLLRPYHPKLRLFEGIRIRKIMSEMTYAAKNNLVYHLWWHPHNFGKYTQENLATLDRVLRHYEALKSKFGFSSLHMAEISKQYRTESI